MGITNSKTMGIKDIERGKTVLYFVVPYLLSMALYYHFGDELTARTVSWQDVLNNEQLVAVKQETFKQFGALTVEQNANISSDALDSLLNEFGINSKGMQSNNDKINLLLKVSSKNFWRFNFMIHPKMNRIKAWKWNHDRYLIRIQTIKALQGREKYKLLKKFTAFSDKIKSHSEFEEHVLFKFLAENTEFDLMHVLKREYGQIHAIADAIKRDLEWINDVNSEECNAIDALLEEYEKKLTAYFTKMEQKIIATMLNMDNTKYRIYRTYLGWNYYLMY